MQSFNIFQDEKTNVPSKCDIFFFPLVEDLRLCIDLTVQSLRIYLGLSQPELVLACFNSSFSDQVTMAWYVLS